MAGAATSQRTAAVPTMAPGAARFSLSEAWALQQVGEYADQRGAEEEPPLLLSQDEYALPL